MNRSLVVLTDTNSQRLQLNGFVAVGGRGSTGHRVETLKDPGDYLWVKSQSQCIEFYNEPVPQTPIKTIYKGETFKHKDALFFFPDESLEKGNGKNLNVSELTPLFNKMTQNKSYKEKLESILAEMLKRTTHTKGLVISKVRSGDYEVLVHEGLNPKDNWLSESVIESAIKDKKPILINNIIGSSYQSSKSLVGTGFLSLFCWPMVINGETLGVILLGSDYPVQEISEELKSLSQVLVDLAALFSETLLKQPINAHQERVSDFGPFETDEESVKKAMQVAKKAAPSDLSLLIQGETGVGKEVMSRWIHDQSQRSNGPFVAINCSAIPEGLLESTLFGHKKGAFTGAHADRVGKFLVAHGGTLFLDEVGDLPLTLQTKLLRVLQEKEIEPVGSNRSIPVDVRLVCATHKDVLSLVKEGKFREDLYYRLAELTLLLPPLRERRNDLKSLSLRFLKSLNSDLQFSEEAWEWILSHRWPGNIRELKSTIKRAVILGEGSFIGPEDLKGGIEESSSEQYLEWLGGKDLEEAKRNFVIEKIELALEMTGGNRTKAAEILGVSSRTLFRHLA